MLLGCDVVWLAMPARDEERVQVERGITEGHREGLGIVDIDAELFETFPDDGFDRLLARLDMPADEVPAVGVPLP